MKIFFASRYLYTSLDQTNSIVFNVMQITSRIISKTVRKLYTPFIS